jgi:hypothetical protein
MQAMFRLSRMQIKFKFIIILVLIFKTLIMARAKKRKTKKGKKPWQVKGSKAAKAHMAKIRRKR